MILRNNDYSEVKRLVLDTYYMARECDANFMMENLDRILGIFQAQERRDSIRTSYKKK